MRSNIIAFGLIAAVASGVGAQDVTWRASKPAQDAPGLTLGRPEPIAEGGAPAPAAPMPTASTEQPRVVRGQAPPPPPPFPGASAPVPPGINPYDAGVVNNDSDLGFWSHIGDKLKRCFSDLGGSLQPGPNRALFQSDRCFEVFTSPVTAPFYFEDPRALTEIRPVFIWQHTPSANPVWRGGNDYNLALTGSVAFTENFSLVINRLGITSDHPDGNDPAVQSHTGFSEFMLGPKFTFIRSETSNTVAAVGLTFDIPSGEAKVVQDTGHLMLIPYFTIAQNFGKNPYGSFNFMNTTGYTFRTDNTRSEAFYSMFHLDYEIAKRFFPLVELNWWHYTRSGGVNNFNFEGDGLTNYGSRMVSGFNDLTLAVGGRIKINDHVQWGIAAQFNVLPNDGGRHLDAFTLTTDFIFRY